MEFNLPLLFMLPVPCLNRLCTIYALSRFSILQVYNDFSHLVCIWAAKIKHLTLHNRNCVLWSEPDEKSITSHGLFSNWTCQKKKKKSTPQPPLLTESQLTSTQSSVTFVCGDGRYELNPGLSGFFA